MSSTGRIVLVLVLVPLLWGCPPARGPQGPRVPASRVRPQARSTVRPSARPSKPRTPPAPAPNLIHARGVGDVLVGKPIPSHHLRRVAKPELRYHVALVADAQAFEGLRLKRPPILVSTGRGPFHRWLAAWWKQYAGTAPSAPPRPPKARLARAALKRMRAGARVVSIIITSPVPRTAKGIGVGSTLAALERAYGKSTLRHLPPEFGKDRCLVDNAHLPARLFFESCAKARAGGPVTIIKLW